MCQKMYAKGTGRCVIIHIEFDSGELIMIRKEQLRLYAITDTSWLNGASLIDVVENVLKNGATFLQLREKNASHDEIVAKAKAIKPIARKYGVPFVIDDDVQAALEADADGVHIGQSDTDYMTARSILGDNKIIGMSRQDSRTGLKKPKDLVQIISEPVLYLAQVPKRMLYTCLVRD